MTETVAAPGSVTRVDAVEFDLSITAAPAEAALSLTVLRALTGETVIDSASIAESAAVATGNPVGAKIITAETVSAATDRSGSERSVRTMRSDQQRTEFDAPVRIHVGLN